MYWLCSRCEELLSVSEGEFANKLFLPYTNGTKQSVRYSSWLMHFCTSLSWRVLRFYLEQDGRDDWSAESLARIREAEKAWREVLLRQRPHAGRLQQHMLPMDRIESTAGAGGLAPNINRYLMRAIHMDLLHSGDAIYTYAKLGRFIVLGFVHEPRQERWQGTKVHATEGVIEPRKYAVPGALRDYLNEKATRMADALGSMSQVQHAKVDQAFRGNIDRYVKSDAFAAMSADVEMFGAAAFSARSDADGEAI